MKEKSKQVRIHGKMIKKKKEIKKGKTIERKIKWWAKTKTKGENETEKPSKVVVRM